jgi:hypothetical protein
MPKVAVAVLRAALRNDLGPRRLARRSRGAKRGCQYLDPHTTMRY